MDKDAALVSLISENPIFSGVSEDNIISSISSPLTKTVNFKPGEVVFSAQKNQGFLGIIQDGSAYVEKALPSGRRVFMSSHAKGDIFGVLTIFSKEEAFPTVIKARSSLTVLFISRETVREIMSRDPRLAENIISYLSSRVLFLNRRIESLAAKTAEEKLAAFLKENMRENGGKLTVSLSLSMTELASALGVGRASLYRALDALSAEGAILRSEGEIEILNPEALSYSNTGK